MDEALRIIVAKSPNAAHFALQCLQAIRAKSPLVQVRYNQTVQIALSDPKAEFTPDERAILAEGLGIGDTDPRDYTLRIRLTRRERIELTDRAEGADLSLSEYARRQLFGE